MSFINITENDINILNNRASFFKQLGKIQSKYGLPSLAILQFYSLNVMNMCYTTKINQEQEEKLVQYAKNGNQFIINSVIDICNYCELTDTDEQINFYKMIIDNGNMCDYFLANDSKTIIEKISSINNYIGKDRFLAFLKCLDPEFNFNEYYKNK